MRQRLALVRRLTRVTNAVRGYHTLGEILAITTEILDAPTFFANKKARDCRQCQKCGLTTQSCRDACDTTVPYDTEFPEDCVPLVHDGEVCLRALLYASCDDYVGYMDDAAPTTASECNFCPPRGGN